MIGIKQERESVQPLEAGKRKASELVFREKVQREIRRGGRMMLTAEIADERFPEGRMTIVATHLEDKTKPEGRRKQLEELLNRISAVNATVVVAGDMNTSTHDGTPLSIERALKNRLGQQEFLGQAGVGNSDRSEAADSSAYGNEYLPDAGGPDCEEHSGRCFESGGRVF